VEILVAGAIGLLTACGIYLVLRGSSFPVVLGLMLLSYSVNLFIVAMGRLTVGWPPIVAARAVAYADPLPQALVLTAIVIGLATTVFAIVLALAVTVPGNDDTADCVSRPSGDEPSRR
jgi:multicomponent K+:H+ antiporter subunit C